MKPQSAGGQVMAVRQRTEAIDRYYENPNFCKNCNKMIKVRENEKVSEARKRKFCTRSCGASYNNRFRKRKTIQNLCVGCKVSISRNANRCTKCHGESLETLKFKTKGEVLSISRYWVQWRAIITKHARRNFKRCGKSTTCVICGYALHTEICHLQDVSDFPLSATIAEINAPENLEALCKNHHWEFDHGYLEVKGIKKARNERAN